MPGVINWDAPRYLFRGTPRGELQSVVRTSDRPAAGWENRHCKEVGEFENHEACLEKERRDGMYQHLLVSLGQPQSIIHMPSRTTPFDPSQKNHRAVRETIGVFPDLCRGIFPRWPRAGRIVQRSILLLLIATEEPSCHERSLLSDGMEYRPRMVSSRLAGLCRVPSSRPSPHPPRPSRGAR
jgi:hypothetical protein